MYANVLVDMVTLERPLNPLLKMAPPFVDAELYRNDESVTVNAAVPVSPLKIAPPEADEELYKNDDLLTINVAVPEPGML